MKDYSGSDLEITDLLTTASAGPALKLPQGVDAYVIPPEAQEYIAANQKLTEQDRKMKIQEI